MTLTINFANEEKMQGLVDNIVIPIRRLSTRSGKTEDEPTTKWRWYFSGANEETKHWTAYEVGNCTLCGPRMSMCSHPYLHIAFFFQFSDQMKLEDAYQAGERQVNMSQGESC